MKITCSLIASSIIILSTIFKTIFDLRINKYFKNKDNKAGLSQLVRAEKNSSRKNLTSYINLAIVAIATIYIITEKAMEPTVQLKDFQSLEKRVKQIEDFFDPPPPGGPGLLSQLKSIKETIAKLETNTVTRDEIIEIKKTIDIIMQNLENRTMRF